MAVLSASDPVTPDAAQLAAVATGSELDRARHVLASRASAHQVVTGRYRHDDTSATVHGTTATVVDCLSPDLQILNARTRKPLGVPPVGPFAVTATLLLADGAWKVSEVAPGHTACPAPSAPASVPATGS